MCGIIAVVRRRSDRHAPSSQELLAGLQQALDDAGRFDTLDRAVTSVEAADRALRGVPGIQALFADPLLAGQIESRVGQLEDMIGKLEVDLDSGSAAVPAEQLESVNAAILRLKDAAWAVGRDRLRTAREVAALCGGATSLAAVEAFASIQMALSAIDRLEVRGRDSAGLHVTVQDHGLDLQAAEIRPLIVGRTDNGLLTMGAVRETGSGLAFVYKAAAEVGELGDNARRLRRAIADDELLRRALAAPEARATVLGHTRWASVGLISEPNAHPLNHEEEGGPPGPYWAASLNGDVDNHGALRAAEGLRIAPEITTDAKVIPVLVSRKMASGSDAAAAFRETVASFEGSVAIGASSATDPGKLFLALHGSGQAIYIGFAEDAFVAASEAYGVVEETNRYLRMDGEATGGQVVILDQERAGTLAGVQRLSYAGIELPVSEADLTSAGITTRDIDRAGYPHFFLKEVSQAPDSFRKTLRGKLSETGGRLNVALSAETLPVELRQRLGKGEIRRILCIGQGTAAVAAQVPAEILATALPSSAGIRVQALPGSELSGFGLVDDMSDTVVIAVSQSGTTTDTNRTVDLVRARGATVLAIVNRRNSDLVEKSDGVLYTSDGRDVEMSVASTKAFYAQSAAGILLALGLAQEVGAIDERAVHHLLAGLRDIPEAMEQVLAARPQIAAAAWEHAPSRRYWAVVGSGVNRLAASELRIKLSELAYKAVACDATEDKKHIDLSSEPLILVCAAGLPGSAASDLAKELAIFRAHKAAAVAIADEGADCSAAMATITVPAVLPQLGFLISAMAGHLFGYEAAQAIDAQARALREARAAVEAVALRPQDPYSAMARLGGSLAATAVRFFEGLRAGAYNGSLEAGTAVRLASLLRYATGIVPLDVYELEHGRVGTPGAVIEDLLDALSQAIDELTRPVDAIKHQAKTVTVGISRPEEDLYKAPLVTEVLAAGVGRDRITYRVLRTLAALGPAVEEVVGWTRYAIDGVVDSGEATARVVGKGGIAKGLASRSEVEARPVLRGTKHRAATLKEVTVAKGATDGRTVIIVPEITRAAVVGITLLHARFADQLPAGEMRSVLETYQSRYGALVDAVTETEPVFDDDRLADVAVIDLLVSPVHALAASWRA